MRIRGMILVMLLLILLILAFLLIIIARHISRKPKFEYHYFRKKFFLTRAETDFYKTLVAVVGDKYFVFAQVHLPSIVDHKVPNGQNWGAAFFHISQKSVDYVLCDKEKVSPILAIELDDRSHERPDRVARDIEVERVLKEADLRILRVKSPNEMSNEALLAAINAKLAETFPN